MAQIVKPRRLNGPEGLMAAVITQAVNDALGGSRSVRVDARRYFASDLYDRHLCALGLPGDVLPEAIEDLANE